MNCNYRLTNPTCLLPPLTASPTPPDDLPAATLAGGREEGSAGLLEAPTRISGTRRPSADAQTLWKAMDVLSAAGHHDLALALSSLAGRMPPACLPELNRN